MIDNIRQLLIDLASLLHLRELASGLIGAAMMLGGIFVAILVIEFALGRDRTRYRSRHFYNDMVYFLFYQSGLYNLIIGALIIGALKEPLSFLKIDALSSLPVAAHWVLYWVVIDFIDYWVHRLKHHSRILWSLHAVHHSQERMTFATSWRFHPGELAFANAMMLTPLLVLGTPPQAWLPIVLTMNAFEAVQHAQLNWTFGPLYKVFVSPVFHAIHHSTEREHYDKNFAKIFSAWDFMFGTAVAPEYAPKETGLVGSPIDETLTAHMMAPVTLLSRRAPVPSPPRHPATLDATHEKPFA